MLKIFNYLIITIILTGCLTDNKLESNLSNSKNIASTCGAINFPEKYKYLNEVECINLPFDSRQKLNIKKLDNGQYDLRNAGIVDKEDFFQLGSPYEDDAVILAKYQLNKDIISFIVLKNMEMEGDGFAQTYNLFSVRADTGTLVYDFFYYVGFSRMSYEEEIEYNKNTTYNLVNKKPIDECIKNFRIDDFRNIRTEFYCSTKPDKKVEKYRVATKDSKVIYYEISNTATSKVKTPLS